MGTGPWKVGIYPHAKWSDYSHIPARRGARMTESKDRDCPRCNIPLAEMLSEGDVHDGWICPMCKTYFTDELKPIAKVHKNIHE
jgi:uncharacterized Zn finger protein (UPF0148 family)